MAEISKATVLLIGSIVLLGIFAGAYVTFSKEEFMGALNIVRQLFKYKRMDITSPEQLEKLMLCLHQRAQGCDSVDKGIWTELEGTPFEGCPCGGDFMAGTDVFVNFKFKNEEKFKLPKEDFAEFDKVKPYNLKCNTHLTDNWLEKVGHLFEGTQITEYMLFYNPNEGQEELNIYNGSQGIVVVNTRKSLGEKVWSMLGWKWGVNAPIIQGCIVINKK